MKQIISTEKRPIKMWLDEIEEDALSQAKNLANFPFAFRHIPLMPDCHMGYGMPIGSVLATQKAVVPNAVGVDIGCGMCAMKTDIREIDREDLKKVLGIARKLIPLGFKWHSENQDISLMPEEKGHLSVVMKGYEKALKQVGTLGGGNHFIELQKGSDGHLWIMIHSGSRNLGYSVAKHYNELAQQLNEKFNSAVKREMGLAFLPMDSDEAQHYIDEMSYCVEFALANRKLMMNRMVEALVEVVGSFSCDDIINKSHNFAQWENHFEENVFVHRKGATSAFEDELGMIPGSQGSHSYIVRGLGNPESFKSCSHGAGRKLGRKQAQKVLDLKAEIAHLDQQGVIHGIRNTADLDEATGAYKDIHQVMDNQKDLAEIVVELTPMAVLKG